MEKYRKLSLNYPQIPALSDTMFTESSTGSEDWEQDFDIELTEEDIKAAEEVARKLNVSSQDYTKLTGEEVLIETRHEKTCLQGFATRDSNQPA